MIHSNTSTLLIQLNHTQDDAPDAVERDQALAKFSDQFRDFPSVAKGGENSPPWK